ncbi:MAG: ACT domain-containing protein [Janthinobacterium lividum]
MAISDLEQILRSMAPTRRAGEYVFVTTASLPPEVLVEASVRETEGPSFVIARDDADRLAVSYDFVAAWITLTVHSALDAVGLTAAVSTALAAKGIPCNVIAGSRHDHLLVPVDAVDAVFLALQRLTGGDDNRTAPSNAATDTERGPGGGRPQGR